MKKVCCRRVLAASGLLLFGQVLSACASQQPASPPPQLPDAGPDAEYQVVLPQPPPAESRYIGLELENDLQGCAVEAPKFFYDGTRPRPQDEPKLEALADCLNRSQYEKSQILLIGKADPRGPDDYNEELGKERAEAIKKLLVERGVDAERITISSAGEEVAVGDTEAYSYGYDRRVDVIQIGLVARP